MTAPVDYERLWQTAWGDLQACGPVHRHIRRDVARVVRGLGVRTILDVGCGSGENLAHLTTVGDFALTGIDVSPEALALARRRVPAGRLLAHDIQASPLDERFDLVMSVQVLEHLPDDEAALRNMATMARRFVYVSTIAGRMRLSERAIGHVRNYAPGELERKVRSAGLTLLWTRGWGYPFYSPLYRSLAEAIPGGPPSGKMSPFSRAIATLLFQLYRLNFPGRGDILSALAQPA